MMQDWPNNNKLPHNNTSDRPTTAWINAHVGSHCTQSSHRLAPHTVRPEKGVHQPTARSPTTLHQHAQYNRTLSHRSGACVKVSIVSINRPQVYMSNLYDVSSNQVKMRESSSNIQDNRPTTNPQKVQRWVHKDLTKVYTIGRCI